MSRLVRLEPPYGRGGGSRWGQLPLLRGPRLARSRAMGRWHRPRCGVQYSTPVRVCFQFWCGQSGQGANLITAMSVPDGDAVCGTCEGRAVGAGHPGIAVELTAALLFEPASRFRPPPICPAVKRRLVPASCVGGDIIACPACAELVPVRFRVSGYSDFSANVGWHPPGPGLAAPCPFHGWDQLYLPQGADRAVCSCSAAA